jgi:2-polyprenyl-3-methyl-5-hydroxy-6-metoxy-1,4-benzoquinol methylase
MSAFEQLYKDHGCVWGKEPDEWLKMFAKNIKQKGKVLEIGVGEGRDAIWMAEQGFEVEGIDNAEAGIEKVQKMARERKLV